MSEMTKLIVHFSEVSTEDGVVVVVMAVSTTLLPTHPHKRTRAEIIRTKPVFTKKYWRDGIRTMRKG